MSNSFISNSTDKQLIAFLSMNKNKFVNEWIRKKTIFKICKYRKYGAIIMPQVLSIKTFHTSKRTYFFTFFKHASGLHKKILSNQLSNSSTNFGLGIKQPEF